MVLETLVKSLSTSEIFLVLNAIDSLGAGLPWYNIVVHFKVRRVGQVVLKNVDRKYFMTLK